MSDKGPASTGSPARLQPSETPAVLPQYPEMIMTAIEALNEKEGSSKTAISKHIEDTYGEMPTAHKTLLMHHLNKMKTSGELVLVKNNYMKPDPNAPLKRGRGRPPKPKNPSAAEAVISPARPRGRPPKAKDDSTPSPAPATQPPKPATPGTGRPRGRPKKLKTSPDGGGASTTVPASGPPRGRGRPPKVKPAVAAPVGC